VSSVHPWLGDCLVSQYFFVVWQGLVIGVHTATIFLRPKFLSLIPFVVASAVLASDRSPCREIPTRILIGTGQMATSDGISTDDWDTVHELSLKIVNAEAEAEANIYTRQLLQYLDELDAKYGGLPSILATRADYLMDRTEREALLIQAYILAEALNDTLNMKETEDSLAELYIEDDEGG